VWAGSSVEYEVGFKDPAGGMEERGQCVGGRNSRLAGTGRHTKCVNKAEEGHGGHCRGKSMQVRCMWRVLVVCRKVKWVWHVMVECSKDP